MILIDSIARNQIVAIGVVLYIVFAIATYVWSRKQDKKYDLIVKLTWFHFIMTCLISVLFPFFWIGRIIYEAICEWDWKTPPRWL